MTIANTPYPQPLYLFRQRSSNGDSQTADCGACTLSRIPPVMQINFSAGASLTLNIYQSHDGTDWALVLSTTASNAYDIIQGWRFVKVNVSSYSSGNVTVSIGAVPTIEGNLVVPNLLTYSNNVPTTAGG